MSYKKTKDEPYYPSDICGYCGLKNGTMHQFPVTYWKAVCGWCGEEKSCTSPRDMGYPDYTPKTMINYCDLCDEEKDVTIGSDRLRICEDCDSKYPKVCEDE